jgi:hypothetical protein
VLSRQRWAAARAHGQHGSRRVTRAPLHNAAPGAFQHGASSLVTCGAPLHVWSVTTVTCAERARVRIFLRAVGWGGERNARRSTACSARRVDPPATLLDGRGRPPPIQPAWSLHVLLPPPPEAPRCRLWSGPRGRPGNQKCGAPAHRVAWQGGQQGAGWRRARVVRNERGPVVAGLEHAHSGERGPRVLRACMQPRQPPTL